MIWQWGGKGSCDGRNRSRTFTYDLLLYPLFFHTPPPSKNVAYQPFYVRQLHFALVIYQLVYIPIMNASIVRPTVLLTSIQHTILQFDCRCQTLSNFIMYSNRAVFHFFTLFGEWLTTYNLFHFSFFFFFLI